jgi:hypothetical protein
MRIANLFTLALVPAVMLACRPDDTADEPWAEPAAEEEQRVEPDVHEFNLSEVAGSGVSGEARVTAVGAQHEVMVRMEDAAPNTSYQGGIYRGTCDQPGERVAQLQAIETNAMGAGQATSTVTMPAGWRDADRTTTTQPAATTQDTLPRTTTVDRDDRDFVIVYHRGDDLAQGVLCGDIDRNRGIF